MEKNKELDINDFLNSFLNKRHERDNLLFDNIDVFYTMSQFLGKQTSIEIPKMQMDWSKISKSTFFQNVDFVDDFFKKMGIQFEINKILSDGTIDIITTDYEKIMYGLNNYLGEHKAIKIYNNGYITDPIVWVHEISHFRNQPEEGRGQVNDLLTEALAHTTSLLYTDYLEKEGFVYEANFGRYDILNTFHNVSYDAYIVSKIFMLYEFMGDTSKETYKYFYKTDEDYEEVRNDFIKIITKNPMSIRDLLWYTLSGVLSVYMYEQYRKDNNFITKIEQLNTSLLKGDSLQRCLGIIGITGYNEDSLSKIEESYDIYKKDLEASRRVLKK